MIEASDPEAAMTSPRLELHGARTGNTFRAAIALEESGLPYAAIRVDLRAGEHKGETFRSLNPSARVPVLIDRRGDRPLVLSQSNAIMLHVAEDAGNGFVPPSDPIERARFFERFFYFVTDVIAPNSEAFFSRPAGSQEAIEHLTQRSLGNLEASERFLEDEGFLFGAGFSIIDVLAFTLTMSMEDKVDWTRRLALRRWFDRVASRPAVIRGLRAFDPVEPA